MPSPVEPTLTAVEMQPGASRAFVLFSFPAAITVAMPAVLNWSMAAFVAAFATSHWACDVNAPPPRLMFTAAML